jgi:hypothetical protein
MLVLGMICNVFLLNALKHAVMVYLGQYSLLIFIASVIVIVIYLVYTTHFSLGIIPPSSWGMHAPILYPMPVFAP